MTKFLPKCVRFSLSGLAFLTASVLLPAPASAGNPLASAGLKVVSVQTYLQNNGTLRDMQKPAALVEIRNIGRAFVERSYVQISIIRLDKPESWDSIMSDSFSVEPGQTVAVDAASVAGFVGMPPADARLSLVVRVRAPGTGPVMVGKYPLNRVSCRRGHRDCQ